MQYGFFDDKAKEYVITQPDTPLPWINYLGKDGFFSLISNTGGGYSFYRDAKLRRITRFRYNNVPADDGGRCFYICDEDKVWSPAYLPARRRSTVTAVATTSDIPSSKERKTASPPR